jgi:hypothetical protein
VLSFVSASTSMLFWVLFLLPFSEHGSDNTGQIPVKNYVEIMLQLCRNYVEIMPPEEPELVFFQFADRRVWVVSTSACYSGKSEDQTSIRKPTTLRYFAMSSVPPGSYVKSGHNTASYCYACQFHIHYSSHSPFDLLYSLSC